MNKSNIETKVIKIKKKFTRDNRSVNSLNSSDIEKSSSLKALIRIKSPEMNKELKEGTKDVHEQKEKASNAGNYSSSGSGSSGKPGVPGSQGSKVTVNVNRNVPLQPQQPKLVG